MDFWSNALPLMKSRGIKQKEIAMATGHSSGRVSDWIDRKIMPKADVAVIVADLLGVSVRYLVTGKADKELSDRENELLAVCSLMSDRKFSIVLKNAKAIREDMELELSNGLSSGDLEGIKGN